MVEKVVAEDIIAGGVGTTEPFEPTPVTVCRSCGTTTDGDVSRCPSCGDRKIPGDPTVQTVSTVPGTCPHCARDRPMVPDLDVPAGLPGSAPARYYGSCPHCGQTRTSAEAAREALARGAFPEWGQGSQKFYP